MKSFLAATVGLLGPVGLITLMANSAGGWTADFLPPGSSSNAPGVALAPEPGVGCIELKCRAGPIFVPASYQPAGNRIDLLVHFHGHPPLMRDNLVRSRRAAALLVINYPGLSAAYGKPFKEPDQFSKILDETCHSLSVHFGRKIEIQRLAVSSFSAGYGAVREILKQASYVQKITDLVLADSLYAGYVTVNGSKLPDPTQLQDFVRFAERAAADTVTLWVTHSQLVPGNYASTVETADVLLRAAGVGRSPASGMDATGLARESVADKGGFHLRSYQGTTGDDHMNHLRQIHVAWRNLGLREIQSAGKF